MHELRRSGNGPVVLPVTDKIVAALTKTCDQSLTLTFTDEIDLAVRGEHKIKAAEMRGDQLGVAAVGAGG